MNLAPLELLEAYPWQRVSFTTYALSLSFFEAVILDRLVRGGGSQAFIMADVQGVRASLSEQGAQRVGLDYEIEPVAVGQGVFHPKFTILTAMDECHLLVGSGNLTFGGWGGNCEILEHLHPSFAASAIADTAEFFQLMPATARVRQSIDGAEYCVALAADLRRCIQSKSLNGEIRLVHNLKSSIAEQLAQMAADLGGASRLVAVAPFWDDGSAIDTLCSLMGLSEVFVHVHGHGCVEGYHAENWPRQCSSKVQAVQVEVINAAGPRRLHAKAFEIMCARGRIIVSGSANGTGSALGRNANVEACIARLQRDHMIGWTYAVAVPPEVQPALDLDLEDGKQVPGVLRAVLEADQLRGEILTPLMKGNVVSVFHLAMAGPELIGETIVSSAGSFQIVAPTLEKYSWSGGRLVICVRDQGGQQSQGYVSVASFTDIKRRTGVFFSTLSALLAGSETPADVAAIMAWFKEDPERLMVASPRSIMQGSNGTSLDEKADPLIPVTALRQQYIENASMSIRDGGSSQRNWSRFIDHILRAFRSPRGTFEQRQSGDVGDDDEQIAEASKRTYYESVANKAFSNFERLFDSLIKPGSPWRNVLIAFDLAQYVCDRLRPDADQAKLWLEKLMMALPQADVPSDRRSDVATAVLIFLAMAPGADVAAFRRARGFLLRLGFDLSGPVPQADTIGGFMSLLPTQIALSELWARLRTLRTYHEQVLAYLQALKSGKASEDYPDLSQDAREEWPILEQAITSEIARRRLAVIENSHYACPKCNIMLPAAEVSKLRRLGIARAKACCSRVVIWPDIGVT